MGGGTNENVRSKLFLKRFIRALWCPATATRDQNVSVTRIQYTFTAIVTRRWRLRLRGMNSCARSVGGLEAEHRTRTELITDERRKICDSVNALVARRERSCAVERSPVTSDDDDDDDDACPSGSSLPNRVDGSLATKSDPGETATDIGFRELLSAEDTCRFDGSSTSSGGGPFAVETRSQDTTTDRGETAVRDNGLRERSPTDGDGDGRTKRSSTARRVGETDLTSGRGRFAEYEPYGRVPWPGGDQGRPSSSSAADRFADFSDGSADSFATADSRPSHGHVSTLPASAERPRQSHCRIV